MEMREIYLLLVLSFVSVARSFVQEALPRGFCTPYNEAFSSSQQSLFQSKISLYMAIKTTDVQKEASEEDSLSGASRFAIMGGMFRSSKDDEEEENNEENVAGFLKSVSKRLSFRRETANGVKADEDKRPQKRGFLRIVGIGSRDSTDTKVTAKQLAVLQKEKNFNRKQQLLLSKQKNRDEQKEKELKMEEKRISVLIAKAEAEKQREQAQRQKKEAKLEAERKRDEARKQEVERERQKAKAAEEDQSEEKEKTSAATKIFSNIWGAGIAALSGNKVKEQWVTLLPKTRIEPGEVVPVQIQGNDLLVVASRDGKVHCLANSCSHMGTPLDTGRLESRPKQDASGKMVLSNDFSPKVECEDCILCPLHHTAFSLETGEVRGDWCPYPPILGPAMGTVKPTSPVATFDIRIRGKHIEVRLNSLVE